MKKEFYKLSIVFIIIVFSFALAFFLGREITLSGLQKSKKPLPPSSSNLKSKEVSLDNNPFSKGLSGKKEKEPNQREKVNEYKKDLILKQPAKASPINKAPDVKQKEKKPVAEEYSRKIYVLFITSHDSKESATEKSTQLKLRFPKWKIFFKKSENSYKVYIGPFQSKESAENFLKKLQDKPDFSSVKLEKI